jgi:hypothetical protein
MKKAKFYRQCTLRKKSEKGYLEQVSWIPEPFCVEGKVLKLREEGTENWDDGWVVYGKPSEPLEAEKVEQNSRTYLKTRKASDI